MLTIGNRYIYKKTTIGPRPDFIKITEHAILKLVKINIQQIFYERTEIVYYFNTIRQISKLPSVDLVDAFILNDIEVEMYIDKRTYINNIQDLYQ